MDIMDNATDSQSRPLCRHFVATSGATSQTPAPLGRYVDTTGAFAAKLAPVGYYVDLTGQTEPLAARRAGSRPGWAVRQRCPAQPDRTRTAPDRPAASSKKAV